MSFFRLSALPIVLTLGFHLVHADPDHPKDGVSSPLILNEILARNASFANPLTGQTTDWVEVRNQSDKTLDLSPYFLTDDPSRPQRWAFPQGLHLETGQHLLIDLDASFIPTLITPSNRLQLTAPFSLNSNGDGVYLFKRSQANDPAELVDGVQFGPQISNFSLGRGPTTKDWTLCIPTPLGVNTPTLLDSKPALKINEWMAAASEGADWIELHNASKLPASLEGIRLTDSESPKPRAAFGPYSYIGIENHGFATVWADDSELPGHVRFKLSASGETLKLFSPQGSLLDEVTFGPQLKDRSEGRMPDGGDPFRKLVPGGTPGLPNAVPIEGIHFSEILSHTDDPLEDAIEIQNLRAESIDLGGWYLSDNPTAPQKYRIPEGTVLEPGGFAVFYRYQFQPRPGIFPSFGFNSAHGDDLYLFSFGQDDPAAVGRVRSEFASAPNGYSFGAYLSSIGFQFDLMSSVSLGTSISATNEVNQTPLFRLGRGATNPPVLMSPLALSEVAANQSEGLDFIEIRNLMKTNVTFHDLVFASNTYTLRGSVDFNWPSPAKIGPGESVLVVGFDPQNDSAQLKLFRNFYQLPTNVQIFGPYQGTLKSKEGEVRLYRPDIPQFCFDPDFGFVAPILVDRVRFTDFCPWPSHGGHRSLQRTDFNSLGDDPIWWRSSVATPGLTPSTIPGSPPVLTSSIAGTNLAGGYVRFNIQPSTPGQDRTWCIQWRFNGELIEGQDDSQMELGPLSPRNSGLYTALVRNDSGSVRVDFPLMVISPPFIKKAPRDIAVAPGGIGLLSVTARGTPPFVYSWRHDGQKMVNQTNSTLVISNMTAEQTGHYQVVIETMAGITSSPPALVRILDEQPPRVVLEPAGLDFREVSPIRRDSLFSLQVVASGAPPLYYQWLLNGEPVSNGNEARLQLPPFTDAQVGWYQVVVSNSYGLARSRTVALQVLALPKVQIQGTNLWVVNAGENVALTTQSEGTPRLYYQWSCNGIDIPAELCKDFTRFSIQHHQAGVYGVRCWNKQGEVVLGSASSDTIRIVVRPEIIGLSRGSEHDELTFKATGGETYEVEASVDLARWNPITTIETTAGTNSIQLSTSNQSAHFYRLISR